MFFDVSLYFILVSLCLTKSILNQDGYGYSGNISNSSTPVLDPINITGHDKWPNGFVKGDYAFFSGVFDGTSIWMIPYGADQVVRVNTSDGTMQSFSHTKTTGNQFWGGVFDGASVWMVPYYTQSVVRINITDGTMTAYNAWPVGFGLINAYVKGYFVGGIFDGMSVWLLASKANQFVRFYIDNVTMVGYDATKFAGAVLPPFNGGIFDGTSIWMIPYLNSGAVVRWNVTDATTTKYTQWPSGFAKKVMGGGAYDGTWIWMIPYTATGVIRINTSDGTMTGYISDALDGTGSAFSGGVFDGRFIWMVPLLSSFIVRLNTVDGTMQRYNSTLVPTVSSLGRYSGGVFDGTSIWMFPHSASYVLKISTVPPSTSTTTPPVSTTFPPSSTNTLPLTTTIPPATTITP
eukprot:PhF_6_TR7228/c0_g1_i1/m.10798